MGEVTGVKGNERGEIGERERGECGERQGHEVGHLAWIGGNGNGNGRMFDQI